jgi:hypothetical protein
MCFYIFNKVIVISIAICGQRGDTIILGQSIHWVVSIECAYWNTGSSG